MTEAQHPGPPETGPTRTDREPTTVSALLRDPRTRTSLVIALAVLAGLIVWIVAESGGGSKTTTSKPTTSSPTVVESEAALEEVVAQYGQQVYWLGPIQGTKYEVSHTSTGVIIGYLTKSANPKDAQPSLSIATYPVKDAYKVTTRSTKGAKVVEVKGGGVGIISTARPTSVYIAFPNVDYQIELFNANPEAARLLATHGQLRPVGSSAANSGVGPVATTVAALRALSATLGHPIYWLGHWGNFKYELTKTADGRVFIRYLPHGVPVGSKRNVVSIATYPLKDAFTITSRGANSQGSERVDVPGGGVAAYSATNPNNIYVAFPGVDAQIQIYAPSTSLPRKLVQNGKIVALGG